MVFPNKGLYWLLYSVPPLQAYSPLKPKDFRKEIPNCFSSVKSTELITFVLICFGVSVKKIAEFMSLADIFVFAPCNAGKNFEWIKAGFGNLSLGATSLVILKYGSWSIAHGIKHRTCSVKHFDEINSIEDEYGITVPFYHQKWMEMLMKMQVLLELVEIQFFQ